MPKTLVNAFLTPAMLMLSLAGNAQTCQNNTIAPSTAHLVDNGDGTISDNKTGLMWKKCSEGTSGIDCKVTGVSGLIFGVNYEWWKALQLAQTVNNGDGFAGYKDWRLPNIKELQSIVEVRCSGPAINLQVFPGVSSDPVNGEFLSSTPTYGSWGGVVMKVDFSQGSTVATSMWAGLVRLVRTMQ